MLLSYSAVLRGSAASVARGSYSTEPEHRTAYLPDVEVGDRLFA